MIDDVWATLLRWPHCVNRGMIKQDTLISLSLSLLRKSYKSCKSLTNTAERSLCWAATREYHPGIPRTNSMANGSLFVVLFAWLSTVPNEPRCALEASSIIRYSVLLITLNIHINIYDSSWSNPSNTFISLRRNSSKIYFALTRLRFKNLIKTN